MKFKDLFSILYLDVLSKKKKIIDFIVSNDHHQQEMLSESVRIFVFIHNYNINTIKII